MNEALLFPLKILLIAIDLFITLITFGFVNAIKKKLEGEPMRSVPVGDDESHRVDPRYKGQLATTPSDGVETLHDLAESSYKRYGDRQCMGTRKFLGWKVPNKVKHFDDEVEWRTFEDVGRDAQKFGAALRKCGLVAAPAVTTIDKVGTPCRIAVFENTCPEWMVAALGAFSQSVTVATVYATLGMDAVVEAVVENSISVIVCNKRSVADVASQCGKMKTLKQIVYTDDLVGPDEKIDLPAPPAGVKVSSFADFVESGDTVAFPPVPPKKDTCAVVMYTSGSTGKPKGVIITHGQVVAACAAGEVALPIRKGEDVYMAYLPLAHIMELMAEFVMLANGITMCYADPKSLTSTGSYPVGALEKFSPTIMAAVPKIWDTIKKGVQAKVALSSPVSRYLVNTALEWRAFAISQGFDTPLFKALVFNKFREGVGGKLRVALSGGGPLNAEVQDFCRVAFCIELGQGYGLTETCAGISIQAPDDQRGGVVGPPIPSVEVKLVSTPEICDKAGQPYMSTDRVDVEGEPVFGRGEIVTRGGNITSGYYMMKGATDEVFVKDGWFHTGDIGQFMSDGSIRIVDRKKNLVKLKGGEYIALEKMEMTYGNSSYVDALAGGICCYGDGDMDRPVALLQLSEPVAMRWAKENGVPGDFEAVKKSKELHDAVIADFKAEHEKSDLSHLEKIVAISFLSNPWTPENGCLTAANKLQRRVVIETFAKEFQEVRKKGIF